jgi:hypothetical protein
MSAPTRLVELSNTISENTKIFDTWLRENNITQPSFQPDAPLLEDAFPPNIAAAKLAIEDATLELRDLVQGPRANVINAVIAGRTDCSTIYYQKIPQLVPLDDPKGITYAELAKQTGVDERALTRIIRNVIAFRLFREDTPGVVTHSAGSHLWASDPGLQDWLVVAIAYGIHSFRSIHKALQKYPRADEPTQTAASVSYVAEHGGQLTSFYDIVSQDPDTARAFGAGMTMIQKEDGFSLRHSVDNYPWGELPTGSTVVDLGGSHGQLASAVLAKHTHLKFVVQDLPSTIDTAPALQADLPIKMMAHDFFEEQPVKGAQVYVFRWILHNWPDKYAVRILDALVPAMTAGSRVLILDAVVPPPGAVPNTMEREMRFFDLSMLAFFNAGDRAVEEWGKLFKGADPRFKYKGIKMVEGSRLSFIEAVWEP